MIQTVRKPRGRFRAKDIPLAAFGVALLFSSLAAASAGDGGPAESGQWNRAEIRRLVVTEAVGSAAAPAPPVALRRWPDLNDYAATGYFTGGQMEGLLASHRKDRAKKLSDLLGRELSIDAVDESTGWTDLHYAAVLDLPEAGKRLLDAGMDADVRLKKGISLGDELWKVLDEVSGRSIDRSGRASGSTPLHWAARASAIDTTRLLVERGADIGAKDDEGIIALHWAAWGNAANTARLLIEKGADVDAKNDYGATPLHYAAVWNTADAVRLLVENGADIGAKDDSGNTPLHGAAVWNAVDAARFLVGRGAHVDARNKRGQTPLHYAAQENAVDAARVLIERGADIGAKDDSGNTPLHVAAWANDVGAARHLVENGADVNARRDDGSTPLHDAALGNVAVVRFLVGHGADIGTKDDDGETPLHVAAWANAVGAARRLVENGADVNARNKRGQTPLDHARHPLVTRFLVRKGAKRGN